MWGSLDPKLVVLGAAIKILLFPAYHSTDFDVHRNWLAVTHNLPLADWYYEKTSQWTLDYPPLFAYFEYLLSYLVPQNVIDDGCLKIVNEDGLYGWPTIVFQRCSVLATELVLAYSLGKLKSSKIAAMLWLCPAWLILDHMHFQYNSALFGLFVLSLVYMSRSQFLKSALAFSTLLCFKHIFLYVAPAFFVALLYQYILGAMQALSISGMFDRAFKLGACTLAPIAVAFGPLMYQELVNSKDGLLMQVISRLFPFSRGLTHSYWAPNFWALYSFADRALSVYFKNSVESATRGVVGQVEFANLPEITPAMSFMTVLGLQVLGLLRSVSSERRKLLESVTLCAFASFLFGWHVHEKAIMLVLVPLALLSQSSERHARAFLPLLLAACFSLFPLIWTPAESVLKSVYTWTYVTVVFVGLPRPNEGAGLLNWLYFAGFAFVLPAHVLIPMLVPKYEYAGLMLLSVYSALGVFWSWLQLLWVYFRY